MILEGRLQSDDQEAKDATKVNGSEDTTLPLVQQRVKRKLVEAKGVLQPMVAKVTPIKKDDQVHRTT